MHDPHHLREQTKSNQDGILLLQANAGTQTRGSHVQAARTVTVTTEPLGEEQLRNIVSCLSLYLLSTQAKPYLGL